MALAFGIAVGSSLQIVLFVAPMLVFAGCVVGKPLDLIFTPFEVAAMTISVFAVGVVTMDGESHWMEGVMLVGVCTMLGIAFFFLPASRHAEDHAGSRYRSRVRKRICRRYQNWSMSMTSV